MLALQLSTGDYMTIGEEVVVQLNHISGDRCRLMVQAPWSGPAGNARSAYLIPHAASGRRSFGTVVKPRH